jgi:hypothetical protein
VRCVSELSRHGEPPFVASGCVELLQDTELAPLALQHLANQIFREIHRHSPDDSLVAVEAVPIALCAPLRRNGMDYLLSGLTIDHLCHPPYSE